MFIQFFLLSSFLIVNSIKLNINVYEPVIGRWKLLYTNNIYNQKNECELSIYPIISDKNKLSVRIKRYEYTSIIKIKKVSQCNIIYQDCNDLSKSDQCFFDIDNGKYCSLILLDSQKFIRSIGVFELPCWGIKYNTLMSSTYFFSWDIDIKLNRLYVFFDNNVYVFERNFLHKDILENERKITTNTFLISNIVSFLLGKFLELSFHLY
jgi:hypothetical protein